jgi:hypothetical protein
MRLPKYLSPSSLKTFEKDRSEFYLRYLADNRPERMPQTEPMAVGSSFDAHVKSYLHKALIGNYGANNEYELDALFEAQVEPQVRDFARAAGRHVFEKYSWCGALSDMMLALQKSVGQPRFEFNLEGVIDSEIGNIPVLGKPDIFFINELGARVVWDWKVNGYCGKSSTSPTKGYTNCRDTWEPIRSGRSSSRNVGNPHKECVLMDHLGIQINGSMYMEDCNAEWADQLAIYAWLLGEPIGSENLIVGIDQIVGCGKDAVDASGRPFLRVANHRTRISANYQFTLQERLAFVWGAITSGHIFIELPREESDAKVAELDTLASALSGDDEFCAFLNRTSRNF